MATAKKIVVNVNIAIKAAKNPVAEKSLLIIKATATLRNAVIINILKNTVRIVLCIVKITDLNTVIIIRSNDIKTNDILIYIATNIAVCTGCILVERAKKSIRKHLIIIEVHELINTQIIFLDELIGNNLYAGK